MLNRPDEILYPDGEATKEEIEEVLRYAIEGRKRVKDQILRIDSTMAEVQFGYVDTDDTWHNVATLEEDEYPAYYHRRHKETEPEEPPVATDPVMLAESGTHSPLTETEGLVRLPARMRAIIQEALSGDGSAVR